LLTVIQRSVLLRSVLLASIVLAPTIASATSPPVAPGWTWRYARIEGMGFVTGLVIQPESPHTIFIKTDVGGVYRFDRANERWIPMMDGFPLEERGALDIEAFATIPGSPLGLAVLAPRTHPTDLDVWGGRDRYGEVWRTFDGGATWQPLGLLDRAIRVAGNGEYRGFTGERLAVDPAQPERMLVASRIHGLHVREADGTWSTATGLPDVLPWVNPADPKDESYGWNTPGHTFVLFDPSGGTTPEGATRIVYVGDHASGVHRSEDGGRSFAAIPSSPPYPARAVVAPDGTLYVSTVRQATGPDAGQPEVGGLFRWTPGQPEGNGWTEITPFAAWNPSLRDVRPYAGMSVHPAQPSILLAATSGGIDKLLSLDRGATWTRFESDPIADAPPYHPPPTPDNYFSKPASWGNVVMAFDPADPSQAWTQNGFGVVRILDVLAPTVSFAWEMANLEELVLHSVLVPPVPFSEDGAAFLTSCMDMMGFRHESADEVPAARIGSGSGLPVQIGQAQGLAFSGQVPTSAAFVGWDTWQPWRSLTGASSDNGRTWTPFADTTPGIAGRIALAATDPANIVWEPSQWRALHVSFDGGASWETAVDLDAEFDPDNPNWNVVGWAFHVSNPWWQGSHLVADRVEAGRFYRYTWGQWSTSADGGRTWTRGFSAWSLGDAAPSPWVIQTRLVPHPTRAREIWIAGMPNEGTDPSPLYRTTDAGTSVEVVPTIDRATHVGFGKGRPGGPAAIYILGRPASAPGEQALPWGAWISLDDAATWTLVSTPNTDGFQRAAALDGDMRVEGRVYVATSGRGVFVGEGPLPVACLGDLDGSGGVDAADLSILLGAWNTAGGDLDGDGTTNGADLAVVLGQWGCVE
jgi:hypothetical protein